jgi:hypothetical protein
MRGAEGQDLDERVDRLDATLLDEIPTQTTLGDRHSLLALHAGCRAAHGRFTYLEIGSHRGGSLQALIRDPRCERIVSIDARPERQPDERGREYVYENNSTAAMLRGLSEIPGADTSKVLTIDAGTETVDPARIDVRPALCFIDAEHTDDAAIRDARFCQAVLGDQGAIAFHDAQIVYRGIALFLRGLSDADTEAHPYLLPDSIFVVEIGEPRLMRSPQVRSRIDQNWQGFLFGLHFNDGYREAMNQPLVRALRRAHLLTVKGVDEGPAKASGT